MSLHFEWLLSFRLRPDAPEPFVEELRYHLGLSDVAPADPTLGVAGQALAGLGDGDALPGGEVTRMVRQRPDSGPEHWGVFARLLVVDDAMYELVQVVPPWLARWSLTQGWIGTAREERGLNPWVSFYVAGGHAYTAVPGGSPEPISDDAPSFALTRTTGSWPPAA